MTTTGPLVGSQVPTYLWVPDHTESYGQEVIDLAASAGLVLDPWQQLMVRYACAVNPAGAWLCFEVGIIVSRQNGKGAILQALELAWLFLFGDELVTHSAHLFDTSREHFLRMQALIRDNRDFSRRVRRMSEGRGAEAIELTNGARLKFITRKGGAGRGMTGNKVVLDEAMYLDADMMAAAVPTLATKPDAQVFYTGSAGLKRSTQLASVRRRGYARNEASLMFAEWAAAPAVYDRETGQVVAGNDPADPRTWALVNPAMHSGRPHQITEEYILKEMRTLGGPRSPQFGTERLGIGDWPAQDATWDVVSDVAWKSCEDPDSRVADGQPIVLALDADPDRAMGTIGVCGLRSDGRDHVEIVERHRGTAWLGGAAGLESPNRVLTDYETAVLDRMRELRSRHTVRRVVVLKTAAAASLIAALTREGLPVYCPPDLEYAQWCGDFHAAVEAGTLAHIGQQSATASLGGARKRESVEGGWRWARGAPADPGPVVTLTLALGGRRTMPTFAPPQIW